MENAPFIECYVIFLMEFYLVGGLEHESYFS